MTFPYLKSPSALNRCFFLLGCTSQLYDSEIHGLILQTELILIKKQKQTNVVTLNQKIYNVYLFRYNSYFYHDMQVVSFDKVKV